MRKIILQEFVSLDGLAAGPDDSVDFIPASTKGDQRFGDEQLALMDTIDTMLLGRVTYQMFSGYWPDVTEGGDKRFAEMLNAKEKVVFSRTLDRAPWGAWEAARIVRGRPTGEVASLKRQPGKDIIVWGSLTLAQSLVEARLVDEYRLVVCPIILGSGRSLFGDRPQSIDLRLHAAQATDRGAVTLTYAPRQD